MNAVQLPMRVLLMLESSKTICECVTRAALLQITVAARLTWWAGGGVGGPSFQDV